jgi:outer membrane protein assembly factor BamA
MGTSLGNAKMIHYLGGLDNSLLTIRSAGNSISKAPISTEQNYVFQTLITPMRGFVQNSRNGTSYAVLNAELRIPLFTVLANRPPRSEFIRNFQIVGFADAGTAWEGLNPFSNNNPLFIETYSNTVSNVRIKKYKTPVVMGMGFGLRTSLLGYFIKFDTAWGLDTGEWSTKPIYYLSFGYDF